MSSGGVPNRRNTVRTFIINIPLRLPRSQTSNPHSRNEGRHIKTLMKHSPSTTLVNVNPRRDFSLRWLQHVKAAVYRHIPRTCYSCNIHGAVRRGTSSIYSRPFLVSNVKLMSAKSCLKTIPLFFAVAAGWCLTNSELSAREAEYR